VSLSSANLISLTRSSTITDKDGDSATDTASINIGQAISFKDDGPSIDVTATQSADALTVDETVLSTNATANYADNFGATSSFGADGAGTVSTSYSLSVSSSGVDSGIDDVATGQNVLLTVNGSGVVEGRTAGSNELVFTVSVDASGTVTLDQLRAVVHPDGSNPDDAVSLSSANLISLTRSSTITDKDGDSATDTASINIGQAISFKDDAPSLQVTGGDTSVSEGQSITNGTWTSASGADAPATTKVVIGVTEYSLNTGIDTGKGTLTVNSNGTWTFAAAPNQSNPQTVTFSVKITDKDGDAASDSHTITINDGADPAVSGGQVMTVNEAALLIGTNPSSTAETDTATLTFTSGSDAITSMVFGSTDDITVNAGLDDSQSITWVASNGGRTLTGSIGGTAVIQLDLTGATSVAAGSNTGNVTVTATLLDNMLHENTPDADSLVISGIKVVGTDSDGDTATHTFTGVTVLDDAPTLSATSIQVERVVGHTLGNYTFEDGADQASFSTSFPAGSLVWANQFAGYTFNYVGGKYVATFVDDGVTKTFFEVTVNSNGTYDFNLVTPAPDTTESSGPLFSGITGGSNLPSFTFDSSKFGGAFSLVLTATDNKAGADTITISATELGINGNSIQEQFDETLKLDVVQQPGFENATVTRLLIGIADTGSLKTGDDFAITVTYKTGSPTTVTDSYDGSGVLDFNIDPSRVVDFVTFHAISNNVNFKVTGITLEYDSNLNPPDQQLNFNLTGADADADTATAGFSVNVIAGTSGDDTLFTGNAADTVSGGAGNDSISTAGGNDILIGGTGMDTLTGGSGSDTYKFVGPLDASNADTVIGFTVAAPASGGDVLDLHDVLPVAAQGHTDLATLQTYVSVQTVGSNTVVNVDADGAGGNAPVTVVTLQGITGVTLQQLLNNNEVHT
jgi:VCBS repeat-containing protein